MILFAPRARDQIYRVSASGGKTSPVTQFDMTQLAYSHRWPVFLPDGQHFLYLSQVISRAEDNAVYVASLDGKQKARLVLGVNSNVAYAPPGYLLFYRDRTLMAQPFDAKKRELRGDPVPVAEDIQYFSNVASAIFTLSDDGVLTYQTGSGGSLSQLLWFDRTGKALGSVGSPADFQRPRISPDGRRVAVDVIDEQSGSSDIWIYDTVRRTNSRFTFDAAADNNPCWSPNGEQIVFTSSRKTAGDIHQKDTSGTGAEQLLFSSPAFKVPYSWRRDGRFIGIAANDPRSRTRSDLWVWSVAERKAVPFIQTEFGDAAPYFSPDGRWIAYHSDETGRNEVYVQPFPASGGKWQVSIAGGHYSVWSADGKELFFVALDDSIMVADVKTSPTFDAGEPRLLFQTRMKNVPGRRYDVSSDGKRFLINTRMGEERSDPITLVVNWDAELKQ